MRNKIFYTFSIHFLYIFYTFSIRFLYVFYTPPKILFLAENFLKIFVAKNFFLKTKNFPEKNFFRRSVSIRFLYVFYTFSIRFLYVFYTLKKISFFIRLALCGAKFSIRFLYIFYTFSIRFLYVFYTFSIHPQKFFFWQKTF